MSLKYQVVRLQEGKAGCHEFPYGFHITERFVYDSTEAREDSHLLNLHVRT